MKSIFKSTAIGFLLIVTAIAMQSCKKSSIPALSGIEVSGITQTSAMARSNITSDGGSEITARGVVWNTSGNPTTNSSATNEGTGTSNFLTIITGLTPNTTYFVRAYATNSEGTVYGEEVSFKTSSEQVGSAQKPDFPGGSRSGASSFSIGSRIYLGLGGKKDFWEWDEATSIWTEKAGFPGNSVSGAVGFTIGTKGYLATGATSDGKVSNELWEFDPTVNTWTQKASLPAAAARAFAAGFSIGTKGYIGTGFVTDDLAWAIGINYRMDFWEWDQETNTWTEKKSLPENSPRAGGVGFSIGTKGYIGTGFVSDGVSSSESFKDFLEYDPANDTWTSKADFGGSVRSRAVGFSIGNKGYIGAGSDHLDTYFRKDMWEWDQGTDTWTRKADLEGYPRSSAVGVSTGSKAFIGMGYGTQYSTLRDLWEYNPD